MLKLTAAALLVVLAAPTFGAPLLAQGRSTVSTAVLDAAVAKRPAPNRAAVRAALATDQATAVAARMGLTAEQVSARVAVLDDQSVQRLQDRILAGGASNVVISTTAIIIILLLLILLTS